jgi:hypothetical protein
MGEKRRGERNTKRKRRGEKMKWMGIYGKNVTASHAGVWH